MIVFALAATCFGLAAVLGIAIWGICKEIGERRAAKIAAAELQMNWFAQIKPTDPAFSVPVLPIPHYVSMRYLDKDGSEIPTESVSVAGLSDLKWADEQWVKDMRRDNIAILERAAQNQRQPAAPACGVAQSCNACSECPDMERND